VNTQLKVTGITNIGLGLLNILVFSSVDLINVKTFLRQPLFLLFPGLVIIGGFGLIIKWRMAWFLNQATSIYVLFVAIAGLIFLLFEETPQRDETVTKVGQLISFLYGLFILIIVLSLIITNKNSTISEFKISRSTQLVTISLATLFSIVIVFGHFIARGHN
jgi:hypothetical protein